MQPLNFDKCNYSDIEKYTQELDCMINGTTEYLTVLDVNGMFPSVELEIDQALEKSGIKF